MLDYVAERLARRATPRPAEPAPQATEAPAGKAITGSGAVAATYDPILGLGSRRPQRIMEQAAGMYREHPWIRLAERTVSIPGGSVDWHLEDENGEEVTDASRPELVAIRDLIEKPQAQVDRGRKMLRRGLWTLTLRHMGVCGMGVWYLDQTEALGGTPLGLLYIAPWRLYDVLDLNGNLLGWTLDKPREEGGMPLDLTSVLPFYLEEPDVGNYGVGLVESIAVKAQLGLLTDRHIAGVVGAGGRLAGLVSPKEPQSGITDDQWKQFQADWRMIASDPQATRRLQVAQGPIDWNVTSATLKELEIPFLSRASRDDVLNEWGVPLSQVGASVPAGLNGGATKSYDEAVLWQKAISPRLEVLRETIQVGILDRYKAHGISVELKLEEPTFDDDAPSFSIAVQALNLPLTNAQRLNLVGIEPTGDPAIDNAIILPANMVEYAVAPQAGTEGKAGLDPAGARATPRRAVRVLAGLRRSVDERQVPAARDAIARALREQAADVAERIRARADHIRRRPSDVSAYWNEDAQNARMTRALRPHAIAVAESVGIRTAEILRRGKASSAPPVPQRTLDRIAAQVVRINAHTRDRLRDVVVEAVSRDALLSDVADTIEDVGPFSELRAETIARTELASVYNASQLDTYGEYGVEKVEAIDGDGDPECAERNGQVFTLDEAESIEDHPNGTLDWAPVLDE